MVVAYLRVSTNKQHLENQQEEIKKFAAHRGLDIDKWYHDVVSGKVHSNDRKLGDLLESLQEGDCLIVTEVSRLSRTLIDIMNIAYMAKPSEYISLQCLHRKLKQYVHVLRLIGTHEWGKGIAELQDASGIYMLKSTLPHNTLLQANREIGRHLQFITQLASNVGFLKQLEGILCYHLQNVEGLLKKLKEESITAL